MKTGKEIVTPAYELMYEEELKDSLSQGIVLRHKKSGARICVVANEDENKVFCVGFRTPPKDSTGVPHILEHSVLCGSDKFPMKDPFVELIKGSLNTFLNAFTAPDHTMYPVASCNDQDFKNLMDVYMDAVFHPNIYHHEEIFMQEGWHYELDENEELKVNGVVYNEMKGAFSSPEQVLFRQIQHSMYPDNAYGVESGGDPEVIPELTYENFLAFHAKYYHPSNSYIWLYGNMDVKERLEWLDKEYLSAYDTIEVDSDIALQKPFGEVKESVCYYPVAEGTEPKNQTYLGYNVMVGSSGDAKQCLAMSILRTVLLSPSGPLYQALVKAGISPNIMSSFEEGLKQTMFNIIAKDTEEDKKEEFLNVIRTTLEEIVKNGVPERSLRAAINSAEFRYREADFGSWPKGLMMNMMALGSWLFDDNAAFTYLKVNDVYAELKKEIGTGYYEELIRKYLLNPEHGTVLVMKPEAGLTGKREKELKEKLAAYKASLSAEELAAIKAKQDGLKAYQDAPETKEILEKLPLLKREDLKKEAMPLIAKKAEWAGINVVTSEVFTSGIAYLKFYFDVHEVPVEKLPYLSLLVTALGYMDTDNYTQRELDNEVNIETGGIFTGSEVLLKQKDADYYRPTYYFTMKALYDKIGKAFELMEEMMHHTKYDDLTRLKEIVLELKSRKQMQLNSAGHQAAVYRSLSYQSQKGQYTELLDGISSYRFIADLAEHIDERVADVAAELKNLCNILFRKENLVVSVTAEAEGLAVAEKEMAKVAAFVPGTSVSGDFRFHAADFGFDLAKKQEAFTCPGQVQYVAKCGNFIKTGIDYTGVVDVANNILSMNYFWDKVRVHGGAYGCMSSYVMNGDYRLVSYRDPNLGETIDVFDHAWECLRDFEADEREMTKMIIGTLSNTDIPLTPSGRGSREWTCYMSGTTFEELQEARDARLNATPEDIRACAELYKKTIAQDCLCVVGSEAKIDENKELFGDVEALF